MINNIEKNKIKKDIYLFNLEKKEIHTQNLTVVSIKVKFSKYVQN